MSNTREFRKNPTQALKMYSSFFLPMKNFLEGQIAKLKLDVDIDQLYPINEAWAHFCNDPISNLNRRKIRMKRKEAPDGHIKRPMSAFMWFINQNREAYTKKHPEAKLTQITSELSKQWQALSEKDRQPYVKKNEEDKARFQKERTEAIEKHKVETDESAASNPKPKKALNAYLYFMKDESIREQIKKDHQKYIAEKGVNTSWMQFLPIAWENFPEKSKQKYIDLAKADHDRYTTELTAYNAANAAATPK
jgi:hypothetical protein